MRNRLTPVLAAVLLLTAMTVPVHAADSGGSTITVMDGITQIGNEAESPVAGYATEPAYFPVEVQTTVEDGKKLIVKTFEVPPGTSPKELVEQSFQRNGTRYEVRDILKKELEPVPESKTASKTITLDVDTDDEEKILSKLAPAIDYDEGGFTGQLTLNEDSLEAEVTESKGYTYTVKDTQQVYGVNRNDPYYVPRTVSKNGATLQLANVNWSPMGERYDVNSIPHLYNATATYTGKAYGSKPTAFEATATYTGQVSRLAPGNVLYTLVYEPAGTVPLTTEEQAAKDTAEAIDWTVFAWIGGGLLLLAVIGGGVFLLVKSGVFSRPKKPRPPKKPKPPKAPRRPAPSSEDVYDDFDDVAYADTEMPDRSRMRIPEAMRQMERPEMGGEAT